MNEHLKPSVIIAPSILAADISAMGAEVEKLTNAGADWLHVDVMDGQFVPPITFGAGMVEAINARVAIPLDVHLMIETPEKQIDYFAKAGANRLTVHIEACKNIRSVIAAIKTAGLNAGVAVNPSTPIESIYDVLSEIDLCLIMTVNPGWGGQEFIPETVEKIRTARRWVTAAGRAINIQVDGGINTETATICAEAGANAFVAGTAILRADDYREAIDNIRSSATKL